METKKKSRIQIAFDTSLEVRTKIKTLAAEQNISMNMWLMRAIYDRISKEMKVK